MTHGQPTPVRMPVVFIGHGSPMNAIEDNAWSRAFRALAPHIPRPQAVLAISAHWFVPGTFVTGNERPPTIHDFGGFPPELFAVEYPAPGSPALAARVVALLGDTVAPRTDWGLDHGTWSVLCHMFPAADLPVVQLSLDARARPERHLEIGQRLAPLRDEGILVLGSGNLVHNLRDAFGRGSRGDLTTPPWAERFDRDVARAIEQRDTDWLARALDSDDGRLAHPTPDHWLPALYCAGAASEHDAVTFPISGFDLGSLSMRAVRWD